MVELRLHRFACVGPENRITIDPAHPNRIAILSTEKDSRPIQVAPHFEIFDDVQLGDESIGFRISELVRPEDVDGYKFLEQFHYRSSDSGSDSVKDTGGRRAVLLCSWLRAGQYIPLGYIELQMPLMMCKPRHDLFARSFQHPARDVAWDAWNQHAMKKYVNLIVRVARVVISPEYRGLGLSRPLLLAGKRFAKERWQIGGRRPLFYEISAEMLRYTDFVSGAGMHYVGDTEGNLERLHADMKSMLRNYKVSSGIMSLQKKYLNTIRAAGETLGISVAQTLMRIKAVCESPKLLQKLSAQEWFLYKSVLRLPRPYHIQGLDEYSEAYVVAGLRPTQKPVTQARASVPASALHVSGLRVSTSYEVPDSPLTRSILESFGIRSRRLDAKVISDFRLDAGPGNVILITGASGTGKTLLLEALDNSIQSPLVSTNGTAAVRTQGIVGWMEDFRTQRPLIEELARVRGAEAAIAALNRTGLSEAFVYLKPYRLLSRGQKYRARLARLLLSKANIWLLDEFCADLDPISAKIVAFNLRKLAVRNKVIAIVAAANHRHFLDALKPSQVISFEMGARFRVMSYREYRHELHSGKPKEIRASI